MSDLFLNNVDVIVPGEKLKKASIAISGGRITEISARSFRTRSPVALTGATVYPGFIDMHIHGADGVDVMNGDPLGKMAAFLASRGTTAWMPTLVPAAEHEYARALKGIEEYIESQDERGAARILGVHYEGPFVSKSNCGALHHEHFRVFDKPKALASLPRLASDNAIHMMTLAPEIKGGIKLIEKLKKDGWVVSLGHTSADDRTLMMAILAGATHMTHFYNAMSGMHHRDPGVVGWGLATDQVSCDVIVDGRHVHPTAFRVLYKVKTAENLSLISDAIPAAGCGDGIYKVWGEKIKVKFGQATNRHGTIAGSTIMLLDAVSTITRHPMWQLPEWEAAQMASLNPARVLGIEKDYGSIAAGKRADLVALDKHGRVMLTIVGGRIVYQADRQRRTWADG